jgi:hypothetical protein
MSFRCDNNTLCRNLSFLSLDCMWLNNYWSDRWHHGRLFFLVNSLFLVFFISTTAFVKSYFFFLRYFLLFCKTCLFLLYSVLVFTRLLPLLKFYQERRRTIIFSSDRSVYDAFQQNLFLHARTFRTLLFSCIFWTNIRSSRVRSECLYSLNWLFP